MVLPLMGGYRIHSVYISLDVAFSFQPGCGHISDFTEYGPFEPGQVMQAENPSDPCIGIWISAIQKIGIIKVYHRFISAFRCGAPF